MPDSFWEIWTSLMLTRLMGFHPQFPLTKKPLQKIHVQRWERSQKSMIICAFCMLGWERLIVSMDMVKFRHNLLKKLWSKFSNYQKKHACKFWHLSCAEKKERTSKCLNASKKMVMFEFVLMEKSMIFPKHQN